MSFNNNTVGSTANAIGAADLQRIEPVHDSNRRGREKPRRRAATPPKTDPADPEVENTIYTPDGRVEIDPADAHIRISA